MKVIVQSQISGVMMKSKNQWIIMNNSGQCFLLALASSSASLRACSPTSLILVPLLVTLNRNTKLMINFVMTVTDQLTSKENAQIYGIHVVMKFTAVSQIKLEFNHPCMHRKY